MTDSGTQGGDMEQVQQTPVVLFGCELSRRCLRSKAQCSGRPKDDGDSDGKFERAQGGQDILRG